MRLLPAELTEPLWVKLQEAAAFSSTVRKAAIALGTEAEISYHQPKRCQLLTNELGRDSEQAEGLEADCCVLSSSPTLE